VPSRLPFKHLTKKQYEALGPDEKLNYLVAAIQARSDVLYMPEPQGQRRKLPARKAKR